MLFKKCDLPLGYHTRHYIDVQGTNYTKNYGEILRSLDVSPHTITKILASKLAGGPSIPQPQGEEFPTPKINPLPNNLSGKIAFHKGKDYIIANLDGSEEFVLIEANWNINSPRIAPGGKKIVFSSAREDQDSIFVIDHNGSNLKRLTGPSDAKEDWYASWSPDGIKLVFARAYSVTNDIFVIDNNGDDQNNLTEPYGKMSLNHFSEYPWSPDGQRIVFSSNRDGNLNLYVMDVYGENIQRITNDAKIQDYGAVWAPNSNIIAFVSNRRDNGEYIYPKHRFHRH